MPVWPGDQSYESAWSARIADGSAVNVGAMTLSLHTGTHADAPLHVRDGGASIDAAPLAAYLGPALVIEAIGSGPLGADLLDGVDLRETPRLLFKTRQQPPAGTWEDRFSYLSKELATRLAAGGAILVGLDTPSVDPVDSKSLDAHHALFDGGVANLENLRLDHVEPGRYFISAVPLYIDGMDASPVRAVLLRTEPREEAPDGIKA